MRTINRIADDAPTDQIFRILFNTSVLVDEVLKTQPAKISELHLTCGFIHPIVRSIFKTDADKCPRCADNTGDMDMTWRPDCVCSAVDGDSDGTTTTITGEIKPDDCRKAKKLRKDITKVAQYSKKLIIEQNLNHCISFSVQDDVIHFYDMKRIFKDWFIFQEVDLIAVPVTVATLVTLTTSYDSMLSLSAYYKTCAPSANTFEQPSESIPTNIIDALYA